MHYAQVNDSKLFGAHKSHMHTRNRVIVIASVSEAENRTTATVAEPIR